MNTLDLIEAASFLKINPEVLRRKAKANLILGRKAGKRWVFIKEHLAEWVSGRYPDTARTPQVVDGFKSQEKIKKCQSTSEKTHGGSNSQRQMDQEYKNLLGLR